MPKGHLHGNQVTLSDDLRAALTTAEDESIDAEEVIEGILLRRSPSARRKAGLAHLREAQSEASGMPDLNRAQARGKRSSGLPTRCTPIKRAPAAASKMMYRLIGCGIY